MSLSNTNNENCESKEIFDFSLPNLKKEKTITIIEYAESCMKTFDELPFNTVDSLMLSQICYMHIQNLVPGVEFTDDAVTISSLYKAEYFDEIMKNVRDPKSNRSLLNAICASPRYRDIKINYYISIVDDKLEKQFAAMTFFLPDGTIYVAFRGTDATIIGWKEDFNMFFEPVIPSHISAVHYLEIVAQRTTAPMYVGGHSKGGNIALYGSTFVAKEIQDRIIKIYNHDGPGLSPEIMKEKNYVDLSYKIETTLPEASIFGLMFNSGDYKVVQSNRMGIMQHDPFSWEIKDNDFIYAEEVKRASNKLVNAVQEIMDTLSDEDKEAFIDTFYKILRSSGATNFSDRPTKMIKEFDQMIATMKNVDEKTGDSIKSVIYEFFKVIGKKVLNIGNDEKKEYIRQIIEEGGHIF